MVPEINLSVKTPLYKLSMGDASSGLWAPEILNEQFIDPVPGTCIGESAIFSHRFYMKVRYFTEIMEKNIKRE